MKELIGKTISALSVSEGEDSLVFHHPDGSHTTYETDADCCSETWFADIVGVSRLIGHTVVTAESVDLYAVDSAGDGRCRQEYDQHYGVKLTTDVGHIDIVYRNSSNGYYGGSIVCKIGYSLPKDLREITEDWQA
jgi:hypothetical protein